MLPKPIQKFIESFSKLPSIGPRMAHRLAFYLLDLDNQTFKGIEEALLELKNIDRCPRCFFVKDKEEKTCRICSNQKRTGREVAIVEKETDLLSIEKSGIFNGKYLVISETESRGKLSSIQKSRLNKFKKRIDKEFDGEIDEIIVAINPTATGDYLAKKIMEGLKKSAKKITRLGRGIPTGGEIEFADEETLSNAFQGRK